ncbi:sulfite exporter TauE/SafE family protein [Aliiroseovarius sp. KMU-50]|uniref:Sulfite exporter TauE/SafE family protein n=1 Tax=Aliiroseovarius salicola TaxID=3009082 RepID=A0ABT4W208_9RHOB|nr:cytochrome c biogenesis protein CcdA [Aliiroseovarius sp. KMU-50]MDA5094544.1 sulfite exporter TauE/SafE family protein [Aliiroseovarius sp. KMU-50]
MFEISFIGAAFAGLLSFASPCILPMVPFYLSYLAGLSMQELRDEDGIAPGAQRRLILAAVAFALGVTTIFILLGLGATALGTSFARHRDVLAYAGAALLLLFGLHFLGVFRLGFLYREARLSSGVNPSSVVGAYLMGLAFGFGWTPCVGPVLASILMIASGMGDISKGAALLAVYGLGMTAPFVFAAFFSQSFIRWAGRNRRYLPYVEKVMGAMLILFAVLIASGTVNIIGQWMIDWFPALTRLG